MDGLSGAERQLTQNMGSLEGYLGERQYGVQTVAMSGDGVNSHVVPDPRSLAAPPGTAEQFDHVANGAVPGGQAVHPATPTGQPSQGIPYDQWLAMQEYASRMEQAATEATRQRLESEDNLFVQNLDLRVDAGLISQEDRDQAILLRYNDQQAKANQYLAEQLRARDQQDEDAEQEVSKYRVAWRRASRAGLNWLDKDIQTHLLDSQTSEDLDRRISILTKVGAGQRQASPTPTQAAAGLMAAPPRGPHTANGQGIKEGSGDLAGYLKAKGGYQTQYME